MVAHFLKQHVLMRLPTAVLRNTFNKKKRRQLNFLGAFILVLRLANIMYRVFQYQHMSKCVQNHYFIITGAGIHIIAQILSLRFEIFSYLLCPIALLSYLNIRFCLNNNTELEQIAVLFDTVVFDIFISVLLSMSWLLSTCASIAVKASLYQLVLTFDNDEHFTLLIYPLALCQIFQMVTLYLMENFQKQAFLAEYRDI